MFDFSSTKVPQNYEKKIYLMTMWGNWKIYVYSHFLKYMFNSNPKMYVGTHSYCTRYLIVKLIFFILNILYEPQIYRAHNKDIYRFLNKTYLKIAILYIKKITITCFFYCYWFWPLKKEMKSYSSFVFEEKINLFQEWFLLHFGFISLSNILWFFMIYFRQLCNVRYLFSEIS